MKGVRGAKGAPSADLLVCFPSQAHLALMPKPICSPARASKRSHHRHHPKKPAGATSRASPLLWAKTKAMGPDMSEPTSPKVTCAGQIKIRHKAKSCKSWQSVMEEIERMHKEREQKKRPSWVESLGLKKEVMQFLACLRNMRLNFRCFGAFHASDITSDDEDDDEDDEECREDNRVEAGESCNSVDTSSVLTKWLMVVQENRNSGEILRDGREGKRWSSDDGSVGSGTTPPPNALLLMRSRSAPAKSWLKEKEDEEDGDGEEEKGKGRELKALMEDERREEEEENRKKKGSLVVMEYDADFYEISTDVVKETWVVGGIREQFSRSRSWKR